MVFVLHTFPEEDLRESGPNLAGYFHAWLGMQLDNGRYCILRKLGWGAFSSVWLVRDFESNSYAALKIMTRKATLRLEAGESDEAGMLEKVASADPTHIGKRHLVEHYNTFNITTPEGSHQCIVMEVLGAGVDELMRQAEYRLPIGLVKTIIRQVLLGLDYLHTSCGIVHTDVKFNNLLLLLDDPPSAVAQTIVASPSKAYRGVPSLGPSPYIIESQPIISPLDSLDLDRVTIKIADLGEAQWSHIHFKDKVQPLALRAPEVILGHPWDTGVDIWSLGCLIIELLTGSALFAINPFLEGWTEDEDHLAQMTDVLGVSFPVDMLNRSRDRSDSFKEDGTFIHAAMLRHPAWALQKILKDVDYCIIHSDEQEVANADAFLRRCLQLRPEDRPTAKELLEDKWLKSS
ncbi:Serine/threonine-protein kinase [Ceratobasidium sp. AG-Ba]|nr:Serine/threonine-protein kinase [Ceratobasidium sp. AG-Ba]